MSTNKVDTIIEKLKKEWDDTIKALVYKKNEDSLFLEYKYNKLIGRGTFGVVTLIKDTKSKNKYALKQVYQDSRYNNRELDIFKRIKHKNIVRLHYYCISNEDKKGRYLYLFMEYYPVNLEIFIKQKSEVTICKAKKWIEQIIDALEYLHSKGICHRDIKPANILLDELLNKIVICDMGSAKVLKDGDKNIPYVCSRYYRSPENILGIETYDFKMDIWSLGCVFVELHTGKTLFKGSFNTEMLLLILDQVKCSESDLLEMKCKLKHIGGPGISKYLKDYIQDEFLLSLYEKMLVFNPEKRASSFFLKKYIQRCMH